MIKNYFKIAWRNLWKNKVSSAINIVGLAIGMAACIVIMLFVTYERSFDSFHGNDIVRLNEVQKFPGMAASQKVGLSMFPMGPALKAEYPEVKSFTRIKWDQKYQMTYGEKRVFVPQVFAVDPDFLKIFTFKTLKGDAQSAVNKPNSIAITKETAEKLFGTEDPIGKVINHYGGDTVKFTVTAVMENAPKNSQLQFDAIYSLPGIQQKWMDSWGGNWLNTYLKLAPGTDLKAFEAKMPAFLKKHLKPEYTSYYELFYLPLKDVHAGATDIGLDYLNFQKFDQKSTNLFAIIAFIVLIIACVNFMNLSTARSADRAKEVGIRKSIGANRPQLAFQFLGETILLSLLALVLALILVELVLPYVNNLSLRNMSMPIFSKPSFLILILLGTVLVGLVSGIYPALFLSSFQPVKVLKGAVESGKNKGMLRNVLVIGQFTSAVFLMIATVFVVKQLKFMQEKDPGFTREQVVTIPLDNISGKKYELFKQQLSGNTLIAGVTASQDQLGSHLDQSGVNFKYNNDAVRELAATQLVVDHDYLSVYNIKLAAGKNFSTERTANGREYIVNESMAKELLKDHQGARIETLLGQRFGYDSLGVITGIVKNFNFNSLHYKVENLFIVNQSEWGFRTVSVKIKPGSSAQAINFIKTTWTDVNPGYPFEYEFLDDHFAEVYRADNQVSKIVGILAGLAILISCLGLFGLASFSAEKRIKEIGVRKVLGASVQNIVLLLSGHFVKLVVISNMIAWPLAWYAMNRWLRDFAFHIDITLGTFVFVALLSVFIALITISFQSVKAAIANPVKSLRSE
ncbi:ABC transporter permease [Mucilaginibacter phyllosphaerae]|uniref:ABC transport system permease protein n=1 Tax=Mucilaginibacter phyllosphaerae TaxID=1812349 RepID=A0A4Y8A7B4_9SPHI|nr:ABC transporter permease [Mucilaginibacter phyllosphaerae]MBB3970791.1 putative ABC transport system permease protein [Mucilaginibacter phyllosphaerae]TEW64268.1 ABC transporter permease [Mucilaginibacter phyllosphaerae]GGH04605.1 ABC transporter permease [Mucilaginibacter phyllosphaerae]